MKIERAGEILQEGWYKSGDMYYHFDGEKIDDEATKYDGELQLFSALENHLDEEIIEETHRNWKAIESQLWNIFNIFEPIDEEELFGE